MYRRYNRRQITDGLNINNTRYRSHIFTCSDTIIFLAFETWPVVRPKHAIKHYIARKRKPQESLVKTDFLVSLSRIFCRSHAREKSGEKYLYVAPTRHEIAFNRGESRMWPPREICFRPKSRLNPSRNFPPTFDLNFPRFVIYSRRL